MLVCTQVHCCRGPLTSLSPLVAASHCIIAGIAVLTLCKGTCCRSIDPVIKDSSSIFQVTCCTSNDICSLQQRYDTWQASLLSRVQLGCTSALAADNAYAHCAARHLQWIYSNLPNSSAGYRYVESPDFVCWNPAEIQDTII